MSSYIIIGGYKRFIEIPAKFAEADKAQTLYLFRRLDANLIKDNRFKFIYCPVIPQIVSYNPLI